MCPRRTVTVPSGGESRQNIKFIESVEDQKTGSLTTVCCWCNLQHSLKQYSAYWFHIFIFSNPFNSLIISIKNRSTQHHSWCTFGPRKHLTVSEHPELSSIVKKKQGGKKTSRGEHLCHDKETRFFPIVTARWRLQAGEALWLHRFKQ